ncbi:hypothetical protein HDU86_002081, partial [Geranomyces michiganensis]
TASDQVLLLLKDTCEALGMSYSKVRSALYRQKDGVSTLVLNGQELREFKSLAVYATTASHLSFVERMDLRKLLVYCGLPTTRVSAVFSGVPGVAETGPLADALGSSRRPNSEGLEP